MLPHLIRKAFLDRKWAAADLDAAAEFWLRLYEAAARKQGFTASPAHAVEIRLRGFPRHAAAPLREELTRRLAGTAFPHPSISLHDPDTLVVTSGVIQGDESPPSGLGLPLLAGPPFDGLCAEVRVRAVGREGGLLRGGKVQTTLVLVGELRGGGLFLKAAWRSGSTGWEDELSWHAVWQHEAAWLAALERFRATDEVDTGLANKLFLNRGADRIGKLTVWMIRVPLGAPRLGGLLLRVFIFAAVFTLIGVGIYFAVEEGELLWLLPAAFLGLPVGALALIFVLGEWRYWTIGYRQFRERYTRMYEEAVRIVPLSRAEAEARLDHPWARKITADMLAAGFTHAGDLRIEPEINGLCALRVFLAPDGATYINVLFGMTTGPDAEKAFRTWPATVATLGHTFLSEGGRVSSVSGRYVGFRRKRTGPDQYARVFVDVEDPAELAQLHMAAVVEFAKETGRAPRRHEPFEWYVRRQCDLQDEERTLYADEPYTWGDHFWWYLQVPRREYRS